MKFKNPEDKPTKLQEELKLIDRRLVEILTWLDAFCIEKWQQEITITCAIDDNPIHKGDTHREGRAVDLRSRDFTIVAQGEIQNTLNQKYPQGLGMVCCILHDVGNGNHFHVQVCRPFQKQVHIVSQVISGL